MKAVVYLYKLAAFFAVGVLFTACGAVQSVELEPEMVLDPDSSIVMALDFSNSGQVADLKALIKSFPNEGLFEEFVAGFDGEVSEEMAFETAIKPILDEDWKLVMGMSFSEGELSFEELDAMDVDELAIYIVGQFEEADKVEALLEYVLDNQKSESLIRSEEGDYTHWTDADDDLYITRHEDLFFLTNTAENRELALKRIANRDGFVLGGDLRNEEMVKGDKIGYVFVDSEGFLDLVGSAYEEMGVGFVDEYLDVMGDVYLSLVVDEGGISMNSLAVVDEDSDLMKAYLGGGLSLVDILPGDGVIVYAEDANFMDVFKSTVVMFSSLVSQAGLAYGGTADAEFVDYYAVVMDELSALSSLSVEELEALFSAHFAFSVSDVGTLYPTFSFYLEIEDELALDSAKAFNLALDSFADDVISQFDVLMVELGVGEGLLKKDVELIAGNGLHKVYVDFSIFPDEILTQMKIFVSDLDAFKVELYYGILNDEVLLVSLYPDLPEVYGRSVLADDELYLAGIEKLGDVVGANVNFVNLQPVMDLYERYFAIAALGVSDSDKEVFEKIKSYVGSVKYFISSSVVEDGLMKSSAYLRIGEK